MMPHALVVTSPGVDEVATARWPDPGPRSPSLAVNTMVPSARVGSSELASIGHAVRPGER